MIAEQEFPFSDHPANLFRIIMQNLSIDQRVLFVVSCRRKKKMKV